MSAWSTPAAGRVQDYLTAAAISGWRLDGVAALDADEIVGAALTAAATRAAFDARAQIALLTPSSDDTARVYERVGFRRVATMLHLVAD